MIFANAASIMREDQPKVNKCCFPLPLKLCLQTWAYTKIISGMLSIIAILLLIFYGDRLILEESHFPLFGGIALLLFVDIGFQIASIVGVHKKKYIILRVFYYYEVFAITMDFILIPVVLYAISTENSRVAKIVIILVIGLFYIMVDVCIIARLKKEIMKIHHKYEVSS